MMKIDTKNNVLKVLLFLFTSAIIACSSDGGTTPKSLLVGVWQPIKYVGVCSSESYFYRDYTSCQQKARLTISADGNFSETSFYIDSFWSLCLESDMVLGQWMEENGNFKLIINEEVTEFDFMELKGSNLKLGQYDEDVIGCEGRSSHYYVEYVRVN